MTDASTGTLSPESSNTSAVPPLSEIGSLNVTTTSSGVVSRIAPAGGSMSSCSACAETGPADHPKSAPSTISKTAPNAHLCVGA